MEIDQVEAVEALDRQDFPRDRPARDDVNFFAFRPFYRRIPIFRITNHWISAMNPAKITSASVPLMIAVVTATLMLTSCGNTIRGVGRDTASAVDATQDAGRRVERAAQ